MSTTTQDDDRLEGAREQARSQFETIQDLQSRFEDAEGEERDEIRQRIYETPLSVQVRSGWHSPSDDATAEQYQILLCTGGPAVRIVGELGQFHEPESARLQCQDWFTEWADIHGEGFSDQQQALIKFARHFYFGE